MAKILLIYDSKRLGVEVVVLVYVRGILFCILGISASHVSNPWVLVYHHEIRHIECGDVKVENPILKV